MTETHNDEPVRRDQLGRESLISEVSEWIANCPPPMTFGVYGDWGSGKTTFLHHLHYHLAGESALCKKGDPTPEGVPTSLASSDGLQVIWFEAWRHQREAIPIVALLREMRSQLAFRHRAGNEAKKLLNVAAQGALRVLDDLIKVIGFQAGAADKLQALGERYETDHFSTPLPSSEIRRYLEEVIEQLLPDNSPPKVPSPRVIVIIDDLDRCESQVALQLLEGIKIYMNLKNCVFVLGMNFQVIEPAIAKQFELKAGPDGRKFDHRWEAREYLGKICQTAWLLPPFPVAAYLKKYLPIDHALTPFIIKRVEETPCLPVNPRKIKALANVLKRRLRQMGTLPAENVSQRAADLTILFASLYTYHPDLYQMIDAQPRFYTEIQKYLDNGVAPFDLDVFRGIIAPRAPESKIESRTQSPGVSAPKLIDTFREHERGNVFLIQYLMEVVKPVTTTEIRSHLLYLHQSPYIVNDV